MSDESLKQFEKLTGNYSSATQQLADLRDRVKEEAEKLKKKYESLIKSAVNAVSASYDELKNSIVENPDLFVTPKTRTISGIKFGFREETDKLVYVDEQTVIELIKTEIPNKKKQLINVKESLIKVAMKKLSADELKKIDCSLEKGDDIPYIGSADNEIDKFINSLMKDVED